MNSICVLWMSIRVNKRITKTASFLRNPLTFPKSTVWPCNAKFCEVDTRNKVNSNRNRKPNRKKKKIEREQNLRLFPV